MTYPPWWPSKVAGATDGVDPGLGSWHGMGLLGGSQLGLGSAGGDQSHRIDRGGSSRDARGLCRWTTRHRSSRAWMAAVLSCGPGAMLSHGSAAALWGIGTEGGQIEVSVRTSAVRRRGCGSSPATGADRRSDVETRAGFRYQPGPDAGRSCDPARPVLASERAVNEADKLDLIDPEALRDALDHRWQPGVAAGGCCSIGARSGSPTSWNAASCRWSSRSACRCP